MIPFEIKCDGKVIFSTKLKRKPQSPEEIKHLLVEVINLIPAPQVVDVEEIKNEKVNE